MTGIDYPYRDRVVEEMAKQADYWKGDLIENNDGKRFVVKDVAYRADDDSFAYFVSKPGRNPTQTRGSAQASGWELLEEGDRPEYRYDPDEPEYVGDDDPSKHTDVVFRELSESERKAKKHEEINRMKRELDEEGSEE